MATNATHPVIYYGTTTFGSSHVPALQDPKFASDFLNVVHGLGISQIDTAARYPPDNHGGSERMLGAAKAASKGFTINTKVLFAGNDSAGTLSKEAVRTSVENSFKHLGIDKIGILYAHIPDEVTPLEEQMEALSEQVQKGHCEKIGLSNFSPELVEKIMAICEDKGYAKPSVYQGQYNLICRVPEKELLPLLRKHNIVYNAYSPLGGGFLTGKLTAGQAEGTRLGSAYGSHFKNWYDKPQFHDAIRSLHRVIEPLEISATGAALRWLAYHSALKEHDGIILGATKVEQIQQNAAEINKGPLPQAVVNEIESIWDAISDSLSQSDFEIDSSALPKK